ncbi:MAG: universal stress protein, partial [Deltaproteobacteria bacterium]|nr:universal stress protein [Deltaproteobacteria bacterium]
ISRGIVETASEENCNFIIMGRQKQPKPLERFFSSIIETVLQKSPCEVALLHGELTPEKIRNILIPYGKDVHTSLAAETAPAFVEHFGAKLNMAVVLEPDITQAQKEEKLEHLNKLMAKHSLAATTKVITDMDVLRGIILESRKMDLIIMGGRSGGFFELLLGQSISQEITERAMCPVLWLKEYEERESFWASLLKPHKDEDEENG